LVLLFVTSSASSQALAQKGTGPDQSGSKIQPFRIAVDDAVLDDLKSRLARTRWPDQIDGTGWRYGVDRGYMKELVAYWQHTYDWREHERQLNQLAQFKTSLLSSKPESMDSTFTSSMCDRSTPTRHRSCSCTGGRVRFMNSTRSSRC